MHPRISVNQLACGTDDLDVAMRICANAGVRRFGVTERSLESADWDRGIATLADSDLDVSSVLCHAKFDLRAPTTWAVTRARIERSLGAADALGAGVVYITTGRAGGATWEQLADAFASAISPVIERADRMGVRLAFEANSPVRTDVSFVHTLADAILISERTGIAITLDVANCWMERDVGETIQRAGERIALVQVGDFVIGTLDTPGRAVPGDGDVPIADLLRAALETGYDGPIELECLGPRIEAEGHATAVARGASQLSTLVTELGG